MSGRTLDLASFRRADSRAVLLCIGLLLVIELAVVRPPWLWTFDEKTPTGVMHVLETKVIAAAESSPDIIILGNSRMRDALPPITLEQALGLERGQVMNLALTGGQVYDSLFMYRRNRDKLDEASVAIVGVEAWFFLDGVKGLDERFVRYATLADRLSPYVEGRRLDAVVGYFWRTFESSEQLISAAKSIVRGGGRAVEIGADGRTAWRDEELARGPVVADVEKTVHSIYPDFSPADAPAEVLATIITMLRQDGIEVILVRPPFRDSYVAARDAWVPAAEVWFDTQIRQLQDEFSIEAWLPSTASEFGWPQDYFLDYGHLAGDGASAFTKEMSDRLRGLFPHILG